MLIAVDEKLNDTTGPTLLQILDHEGTSPLYLATTLRRLDIIKAFTANNYRCSVSSAGPEGRNALHAAVLLGTGIYAHNICCFPPTTESIFASLIVNCLSLSLGFLRARIIQPKKVNKIYRENPVKSSPQHDLFEIISHFGTLDYIYSYVANLTYKNVKGGNFDFM